MDVKCSTQFANFGPCPPGKLANFVRVEKHFVSKVVMDAAVTGILLEGAEADQAKQESAEAPEPKKGFFGRLFG